MRAPERSHLALALLLSALLHGALVAVVPGMKLPELIEPEEELLEFELREAQLQPEPEPEPLKRQEEALPPEEPAEASPPEETPLPEESQALGAQPEIGELDAEKLTNTLRSELPAPPARTPKPVWLPMRRTQKFTVETIAIAQQRHSIDQRYGDMQLKRVGDAPITRSADMAAARAVAKKLLASLGSVPTQVKGAAPPQRAVKKPPGTPDIGGEVGIKRTVVRHPPPPNVQIDNPVTVEMEFWVSPGGDVIRAHALRTGETALDRAAAKYVKGFKFNALDTGEVNQQRGTILVRFSWK